MMHIKDEASMDFLFKGVIVLGSSIPLVAGILAQAAPVESTDWIGYVLNGGPFAVVVFLLVTDRLTTPGERDRLRRELTASHEREAELNQEIREEIVPHVTRGIEAMTLSREATERVIRFLDERFPPTEGK
jgi:hypothetical protein